MNKEEIIYIIDLKCPNCCREYETREDMIMSFCPCGWMNEIKIILEVENGRY